MGLLSSFEGPSAPCVLGFPQPPSCFGYSSTPTFICGQIYGKPYYKCDSEVGMEAVQENKRHLSAEACWCQLVLTASLVIT